MAATVEGANTYFTTHLDSAKWTALTTPQKAGAIATAQAEINSLPLRKKLAVDGITLIDVIPETTKDKMIYEQALFLVLTTQDRQNLQAQGVKSVAISGGASETFSKTMFGVALAPRVRLLANGYWALGAIK